MKELNASPGKLISIGYEGEDKVTKIVFRYDEDWLACGDGRQIMRESIGAFPDMTPAEEN